MAVHTAAIERARDDGRVRGRHLYRPGAGFMEKNASGKEWVARVVLRPHIVFSGAKVPNDADVEGLHHEAHAECFLANSVKTSVATAGSWEFRNSARDE